MRKYGRLVILMFQTSDNSQLSTEKITENQCRADYCLKFET